MHHFQLLLPILLALDRASCDHNDPPPAAPISDHEFPREVVNPRPYPGRGVWKQPPAHIDVGFVPEQTYSQVRKTYTVKHLPQSDALASATSHEEVLNAPRLREVVKHTTIREVYEEEGFGDNAYDHAGYKKTGEHDEAYAIGESAKKKRSGQKTRSQDSEGQHSQPVANQDGDTSTGDGGNRNVRAGKVMHQMEISRGVEKMMEGGGVVKTGTIVRGSSVPRSRSRVHRPRMKLLRGEVNDSKVAESKEVGKGEAVTVNPLSKGSLKKRESRQDSDEDFNEFADDVNKDMEDEGKDRDPTKTKYLEAHEEEERLRLEDEEREAEIQQHYLETTADILKGFPKMKTGIDHVKFPFYASTTNKNSPLRYALNPREIPDKRGRDMAFYESKDVKECEEVTPPVITRGKNKEGQPKDKLPRMGQLGDKINCFKNKYWGEEPLDNPFFTEGHEVVAENKKRAIRDEERDTIGDQGFYSEIVGSIKHLEAGSFPDRNLDLEPRDLDRRQSYNADVYSPPEERNENYEDIDDHADDEIADNDKENENDDADVGVEKAKRPTYKPHADKPIEEINVPIYKPKPRFKPKIYPVRDHAIVLDLSPRPVTYPITQPKFRPSPVDEQPPRNNYLPPIKHNPSNKYNPPAKISTPNKIQNTRQGNEKYLNILGMYPPPANTHFQYQTLTYLKPSVKSYQGSRYDTKSLIDSLTMATADYVADLTSQQNKVRILRTKRDVSADDGQEVVTEEPRKFYKKRSRFRSRPVPKSKNDSSEEASTERFVENRDRRKVKQYKVTEDVKEDFDPESFKSDDQDDVLSPSNFKRVQPDRSFQSSEEQGDGNREEGDDVRPTERTKPKRRRKMRRFKRPLKSKWVNYQAFEVTDKDGTKKEVQWKDSDGDDKRIEEEVPRPRKHKSKERKEENRDEFYKEGEGEENLNSEDSGRSEGTTEESPSQNDTPVDFFSKLKDDEDEVPKRIYRRRKIKKNKGGSDGILEEFSKDAEKKNEESFYKRRKPNRDEGSEEADSIDEFVPKYEDHDHENTYANRKVNKDERWADRTLDDLIGKVRVETREDEEDEGERRPRKRKNRRRPGANIDELRRDHGDTLERLRKQHDTQVEVYSKPEEEDEEGEESRPFGENLDGLIAERLVKLKENDVHDVDTVKEVKVVKVEKKISTTMTPLQEIASKYPQMWMDKKNKVADQTDEPTTIQAVVDKEARKSARRPKNAPQDELASKYEEYSIDERRREPKYKDEVKEVKEGKEEADGNKNNTQVTIHEEVRLSGEKLPPPIRLSTEEINAKLAAIFKGHKFGSRYNAKKPESNVNTQRKLRADEESDKTEEGKDKVAEERAATETDTKVEETFRGRKNFKPRSRTTTSRRPSVNATTESSVVQSRTSRTQTSRSKTEDILESKTKDQRLNRRPSFRTTTTTESPLSRKPSQERSRNRFSPQTDVDDAIETERLVPREWPRRISTTIVPDTLDGDLASERRQRQRVTLPTFEETSARGAIRKLSRKSRHKSTTPQSETLTTTEEVVAVTEAPKEKEATTTKAPRRVFIFKKPTTTLKPEVTTIRTYLWTKKPEPVLAKPDVTTNKPVTLRYNIPVKDIVLKKAVKEVETNKIDRPRSYKGAVTERNVITTTPRVLANFETRRVTNQETFTRIHKQDDDDDEDDDEDDEDDDEDDEDFYDTYFGDDQDPFQSQRTEKYASLSDKEAGFRGDGNFLKDRTLTYVVPQGSTVGTWVEES